MEVRHGGPQTWRGEALTLRRDPPRGTCPRRQDGSPARSELSCLLCHACGGGRAGAPAAPPALSWPGTSAEGAESPASPGRRDCPHPPGRGPPASAPPEQPCDRQGLDQQCRPRLEGVAWAETPFPAGKRAGGGGLLLARSLFFFDRASLLSNTQLDARPGRFLDVSFPSTRTHPLSYEVDAGA